jgi:succinate dehydrogenase / fumarate reductase membrane anchor subunit|nr:MAG: succinate dehydrogenase, hydrophobic membrane anchor protein [Pseudomonadota bacterium]
MALRTPLKNVRRLGSAGEGTEHFWRQRVTSVAALLLLPFMLWIALSVVGADYETVKSTLRNPIVAILLISFIVTSAVHMRLGMQVIIEDYVHTEGAKIALLMLNTFFAVLVALASVFAVLRLSFGVGI